MMTTDQRMALRATLNDPDSTQVAKDAATRALFRDLEEQQEAQAKAFQHYLDTYVPYDEDDRITFERVKRTRVHPANASVPRGWNTRIDILVDTILIVDPAATFSQFKSKFGGLRVYGEFNAAAQEAVRQAEMDCRLLCFWCGSLAAHKWNYEPACADHKKGVFNPHDQT